MNLRAKILAGVSALLLASGIGAGSAMAASQPVVTSAAPGNIYGCVDGTNRTLEHVYTVEANFVNYLNSHGGKCPSGFAATVLGNSVAPAPTPTASTPTPTPTQTTPTPTPTQTTPTPTPTGSSPSTNACVTSDPTGGCGPFKFAGITQSNGFNTYVGNNIWNNIAGTKQTLTANSPGDWNVSANMPAGNGAVVSYPQTQQLYTTDSNTPAPLTGFSALYSSFTESMTYNSKTSAEAAYDIWLGQGTSTNGADEVMIWNDTENRSLAGCKSVANNVTLGGANGSKSQTWNLCNYGNGPSGEWVWTPADGTNTQSETLDLLPFLNWMVTNGSLPAGTGINQVDYGFEICSTGGVAEPFTVSSYTLTSK